MLGGALRRMFRATFQKSCFLSNGLTIVLFSKRVWHQWTSNAIQSDKETGCIFMYSFVKHNYPRKCNKMYCYCLLKIRSNAKRENLHKWYVLCVGWWWRLFRRAVTKIVVEPHAETFIVLFMLFAKGYFAMVFPSDKTTWTHYDIQTHI